MSKHTHVWHIPPQGEPPIARCRKRACPEKQREMNNSIPDWNWSRWSRSSTDSADIATTDLQLALKQTTEQSKRE
jgi:hypothetical protein